MATHNTTTNGTTTNNDKAYSYAEYRKKANAKNTVKMTISDYLALFDNKDIMVTVKSSDILKQIEKIRLKKSVKYDLVLISVKLPNVTNLSLMYYLKRY